MIRTTGILCLAFKRCAQRPNTWHLFQIHPNHVVQRGNVVSIYQASCLSSVVASEPAETGNEKTQHKKGSKSEGKTPKPRSQPEEEGLNDSEVSNSKSVSKLLKSAEFGVISKAAARDVIQKITELSESEVTGMGGIEIDPRYIQLQKLKSSEATEANHRIGLELMTVMKVQTLSRAIELVERLPLKEQIAVMKNLALQSQRTVPLLDKIAESIMRKRISSLDAKDSSDVLFSMALLNYCNIELLHFISKSLKQKLSQGSKAAVVGSTITSLRKLLWRDEELLEGISQWLVANIKNFRAPSNFLYTLAILNYVPTNHENLIKLIWKDISENKLSFSSTVSVVWALVVLEKANGDHFSYIFHPDHYKTMNIDGQPPPPTLMKLLNINAAAKQCTTYKGPYLPQSISKEISMPVSRQKNATVEQLRDMLFARMDNDLYQTFAPTGMGFSIDLVCALESTGEPVPINSKSKFTRVAVTALHFHDTTQPAQLLTGYKVIEKRLLEGEGYKVITFPYQMMANDIPPHKFHEFFKEELDKALDA